MSIRDLVFSHAPVPSFVWATLCAIGITVGAFTLPDCRTTSAQRAEANATTMALPCELVLTSTKAGHTSRLCVCGHGMFDRVYAPLESCGP